MPPRKPSPAPRIIWVYAYEIVPPQAEARLRGIQTLLHHEHSSVALRARTWQGRLVGEQLISHILVVSDNPDLDHDVNLILEAELNRLEAGYFRTAPMAVGKITRRCHPDSSETRLSNPRPPADATCG